MNKKIIISTGIICLCFVVLWAKDSKTPEIKTKEHVHVNVENSTNSRYQLVDSQDGFFRCDTKTGYTERLVKEESRYIWKVVY